MAITPPDGRWAESGQWEKDSKASNEAENFGKLGAIQERGARLTKAKEDVEVAVHVCLGWIVPGSLIIAFILFWMGVIVYLIHMMSPWGWLKPDQLKELHTVLFSGAIGAIVAQSAKRYIGAEPPKGD